MAGTADGRFLTDRHRRWQAKLGAAMVGVTMDLSSLIDPENIPGTFDAWLEQQVGALEAARIAAADEAKRYVKAYRAAELGPTKAANLPLVEHVVDLARDVDSVAWAPWTALAAITGGQNPAEAWATVAKQLAWKTQNLALTPGRDVVWKSAEKAGGRWRRVSDGNPCAWCAMLVTRGPVYSKATATTTQAGRRYHYACGCTAEEVFGEWEPTEQEQAYIDLYDAVHEGGNTGAQVAAKMRAYGQGVVHDADKSSPVSSTAVNGGVKASSERITRLDQLPRLDITETYNQAKEAANISWVRGSEPVENNCNQVVEAMEMRARGYDVTAQPTVGAVSRSDSAIAADWIDPATGRPRMFTGNDGKLSPTRFLKEQTQDWAVGDRGFVAVAYRGKYAGGHVFNIAKEAEDSYTLYEGQIPNADAARNMANITKDIRILRVSDLEPTDALLQRVMPWTETPPVVTPESQLVLAEQRYQYLQGRIEEYDEILKDTKLTADQNMDAFAIRLSLRSEFTQIEWQLERMRSGH